MSPEITIKGRIAQIKASGKVAPPKTWLGTTSITKKNGKRYTYYRLMTAVATPPTEDNPNPSPKTKMVQYLGTRDSQAYQEMKAAIDRRNEIQRLTRKLQALDQAVSAGKAKKPTTKQKPRQSALTTLVMELVAQVQTLVAEIAWMKRQFIGQFGTTS
jgi:hypothetical protein